MTTATRAYESGDQTMPTRLVAVGAMLLLLATTIWAGTAGQKEQAEPIHASPSTVEHIAGGEFSWVTLVPEAAERLGLEVTTIVGGAAGLVVPYEAVIHAADGRTWVYTTDGEDLLRFRRHEVVVAAVESNRATLSDGPPAGTIIVGVGAAELFGTEFEVGH